MTATLEAPARPDWYVEPVAIGPTWTLDPKWDGVVERMKYILPGLTLGWEIIAWVQANLQADEPDHNGNPQPFKLTFEQKRFVLWWYAVDNRGVFLYRDGILQRLKGWGKDPLAAVLSAVEFVGPCRFARFSTQADVDNGFALDVGEPIAKDNPRAWIQIAAVSKEQTKNTMTLFPGLFSAECMQIHGIDIGKEIIYAYKGQRQIQAVTSSPRTLEGARASFVIRNETHHWLANNEGHAMADVIERNATKSKDGSARALSITNAYEPHEDSVAQRQREAWEQEHDGIAIDTGVLYDSLEMPETVGLQPPHKPTEPPTTAEIKAWLEVVIKAVRGDATWLNVERITKSILSRENPPSRSRRFWLNQIWASEEAWVHPTAVDLAVDPIAKLARASGTDDILRAGWLILPTDEIALFFDGSKSDDSTGLVGCRISDGYTFLVGVWERPKMLDRAAVWRVPHDHVDSRVIEIHGRARVVAFWGDPSHAQDDDPEGDRYWDPLFDEWHRRYSPSIQKSFWSVQSGDHTHAIMWDMTSPQRSATFTAAAETYVQEMEAKNDVEEFEPTFRICGHPTHVRHLKNAQQYPNKWGTSLWKGGRMSANKIDVAVCSVGARMLRRIVLNKGIEEEKQPGDFWGGRRSW